MKKFIVTYHSTAAAMAKMANMTQEDMAKGMEGWMVWAQKCGDQLVDMGSPLCSSQKLNSDGTSTKSTKEVTGYSILQAKDMEEAKTLLAEHPHYGFDDSCSIEVHETMALPGM